MKTDHCILICDRFAREAEVATADLDGVRVVAFPARCEPADLGWDEVSAACGQQCARGHLFGCTCLAGLGDPPAGCEGVRIHRFEQCFYLIAGRDLVDAYLRDGAHLYTPGWLTDWRQHLDELGLDGPLAREFFADSTSRLILLDTGVDPTSGDRLRELAAYVDRPFEIVPVGLDHFRLVLSHRLLEGKIEEERSRAEFELGAARRQASDYAMAMDLVEGLAQSHREDEVVDGMLELFTTLFAPAELRFLPWREGRMGALRTVSGPTAPPPEPEADPAAIRDRLARFHGDHSLSPSGHGFLVRLAVRGETVGILELEGLAFPAHLKHYLNLALGIVPVCALAIHNARAFEQITAAEAARRESEQRFVLFMDSLPGVAFMKDLAGRHYYVNRGFEELFHLHRREWYGKTNEELFPPAVASRFTESDQRTVAENAAVEVEEVIIWDGVEQRWLTNKFPIPGEDGSPMMVGGIALNITARKRAEEQIAASLKEKEVLLREIHHRVKNNMQVITSLLRLQGRKLRDPEALVAFEQSEHRIRAMALIHETLYQSEYLARVSCQDYLGKLVRGLTRASGERRAAAVVVDAADVALAIDQAVPVGLIINELVTNALKHAYPAGRRGEIRVAMHPTGDGDVELVVGDDGVGLPPEIDPESTATLGLRLVRRLAEDQLGGRLGVRVDGGTRFAIRFHPRAPQERTGRADADRGAGAIAPDGAGR